MSFEILVWRNLDSNNNKMEMSEEPVGVDEEEYDVLDEDQEPEEAHEADDGHQIAKKQRTKRGQGDGNWAK